MIRVYKPSYPSIVIIRNCLRSIKLRNWLGIVPLTVSGISISEMLHIFPIPLPLFFCEFSTFKQAFTETVFQVFALVLTQVFPMGGIRTG